MPIDTSAGLVDALRQSRLLESDQLNELTRTLLPRFPDPKALARHLIQLGWLTAYQVNQLFQGQGPALSLGQYRVLERLGEGGMGQVFKARHQAMGRIVALKVIRKDRLGNTEAVKRFQREMHAAGQLSHPNVVTAFDADSANGMHYFAMEYVDGTDLARIVKEKGPMSVAVACECIRQAALGLQHAHEKGLVHRDIKPSNFLVTVAADTNIQNTPGGARRGKPLVKILDMGLARLQQAENDDATMLSQDGHVIGTPDFMAPEQAKNSSKVDHRADIYGLGCTFYYLLTGKPLFAGGSNIEKLLKHQMDAPPPIEKTRADVPEGVKALLQRMLAKRPEDRIQRAGDVAASLEPFCRGGAAPAPLPSATERISTRPTEMPITTPATPMLAQRRTGPRPLALSSQALAAVGKIRWTRGRLIAAGVAAGVGLLGLFLVVLLASSGGKSSSTSLAAATQPAPPPDTRRPATERKQPTIDPITRFLFAETGAVMSINVAQLKGADVYRTHREKVLALLTPFGVDPQVFGDGYLADAERVTLAVSSEDMARGLHIYQGQFDPRKLKAFVDRSDGRSFRPKDGTPQVEFYELRDVNGQRLLAAQVTPTTFVFSPNYGLVLGAVRRFHHNEGRHIRDQELQTALEYLDPRASIALAVSGHQAYGAAAERSTLLKETQIRLLRGAITFTDSVNVQLSLTAADAAAVPTVENVLNDIKTAIRQSNRALADHLDVMFADRPVRGPNNGVTFQGRLTPKQTTLFFNSVGR